MKNLVQCCLLVVMICSVFLSDQVHSSPSIEESKRDELIENNADSSDASQEQMEEMDRRKYSPCPIGCSYNRKYILGCICHRG